MSGLLSIREAARMLGLSPYSTYVLARRGKLPGLVRLGARRLYVKRTVLEQWLRGEPREPKDGAAAGDEWP
jgi:excisionase family DNA binding protein